jgi:hypothetical protein
VLWQVKESKDEISFAEKVRRKEKMYHLRKIELFLLQVALDRQAL